MTEPKPTDIERRLRKRLHAQLAAFVVLAAATAFSFQQERAHSNESRKAIAAAAAKVVHDNCVRGNSVRIVIRQILKEQKPAIDAAIRTGRISAADGATNKKRIERDITLVPLINCSYIASSLASKAKN